MHIAILFDDTISNGQTKGYLSIEEGVLKFTNDEIKRNLSIDHDLKLTKSIDGKTIYFNRTPQKYYIETSSINILSDPRLAEINQINDLSTLRKDNKKINTFLGIIALFFFGGLALLFSMREPIINKLVKNIPPTFEKQIGQQYIDQLALDNEIDTTYELNNIFKSKARLLLKNIPKADFFQLYVSISEEINAYALPGGYIVFNKGLLRKAKNWGEVLGVLAHEAAHVTASHHTRGALSKIGITTLLGLVFGDGSGLSGVIIDASSQLEQLTYSRGFEKEADELGLEYLQNARINPIGLKTFFETLEQEEKNTAKIPELLSTHPSPNNRIKDLESRISSFGKADFIELGDYSEFKQSILADLPIDIETKN